MITIYSDLMMYKLIKFYNVDGKFYQAVKSIHENSVSRVRINNLYTEWFSVTSGVRQGDSFSPLLFSLYINDLAIEIMNLNCGVDFGHESLSILMYADDIALVAPTEDNLQSQINCLFEWCRKWRMLLNTEKTQIVHFRPVRKIRTSFVFKFGHNSLKTVDKYKYLGVYLDEFLNYSITANLLAESGGRALGCVKNILNSFKECGYNTFTHLFNNNILPILNYAAGVWGFKRYDKLDNTQRKAMRFFLGVHRFVPNHAIAGDMGWPTTSISRHVEMLRLWNRLVTFQNDRLTRKIFEHDYNCLTNNWSFEVKQILTKIGQVDCFISKTPCDIENAKECLLNIEMEEWDNSRFSKSKLRYYNMFKVDFGVEEYLLQNMSKHKRSLMTQFRSGILPLNVETGRFRNIPLGDRVCTVCNMNQIEDEFHFIIQCELYDLLRQKLYDDANSYDETFVQLDDLDKFLFLNINCQKSLAEFIFRAMVKRTEFLYN